MPELEVELNRTPLYETHALMGGKIIEFNGWALPVEYSGILDEHRRVRTAAGLFDVSHMGELTVQGPGSTDFVQHLVTNDISRQKAGQAIYSPMCREDGGTVDDLLIYKFSGESFMLVVNAGNTDKDFEWVKNAINGFDAEVVNVSANYAQLALQGPKAVEILQKLIYIPLNSIKYYHFREVVKIGEITALVSRTGYTGEDGFELYVSLEDVALLWNKIMDAGKGYGIVPAGLGARDTLRFEAALPLYGQELSESITPVEARLERFIGFDKSHFTGKEALTAQKACGSTNRIAGFEMLERGIARHGCEITSDGRKIGHVTSGSFAPTLMKNIGLALVKSEYSQEGTLLEVIVRGKSLKATVVKTPFYTRK